MSSWEVSIGDSLYGPLELVVTLQAETKGEAIARRHELLFSGWEWQGCKIDLPGLKEGETARLLTNPEYWKKDPEETGRSDSEQMTIGDGCGETGPEGYRCTHHENGEHVARGTEAGSWADSWPKEEE